jgi:stage II sporulation protein R
MLPDYEIIRNESPQSKRSPWTELIFSLLIIQILLFVLPSGSGAAEVPEDAIHVRIVANSNTVEDQAVKSLIQEEINPILQDAIETAKTVDELEIQLSDLSQEIMKRAGKITEKVIQIKLADVNTTKRWC